MKKKLFLLVMTLAVLLSLALPAYAAFGDQVYGESEDNDSEDYANIIEHDFTVVGDFTMHDTDYYVLQLDAPATVTITAVSDSDELYFCHTYDRMAYNGHESELVAYEDGLYYYTMTCFLYEGDQRICFYPANASTNTFEYMFYVEVDGHVHTWGEWTVDTPVTCLRDGQKVRVCSSCGVGQIQTITARGFHAWNEGAVTTEPSYTAEGVISYICADCGETKTEKLPKIPHDHVYTDTIVEPDCVYAGYTLHTCDLCGVSFTDSVVANLGHDWSEGECLTCGTLWEEQFVDVESDEYYYEPVMWAVENGITAGSGLINTFEPDADCTRAQVVTFLHRAAGTPEPTITENPFTDVEEDDWYYNAVLWAVENKITQGTTATTFSPEETCTRAQVATFLHRSAGNPEHGITENPFVDVEEEDYFYNPVLWAYENAITMGDGAADTFNPDGTCIRGQIVTFLFRAANIETPEEPEIVGVYTEGETSKVTFYSDGTCLIEEATWSEETTYIINEDGDYEFYFYVDSDNPARGIISAEDVVKP